MYLALRELRYAWGRFALVGSVIGLVAVLTVMLSGLASGLVDDGISGLRALPVTNLAFSPNSHSTFTRSTVDSNTVSAFADVAGVEAEPLGVGIFNAKLTDGTPTEMTLFGVEPGGYLTGSITNGGQLASESDGVVISQGLADSGVGVGDHIVLDRSGIDMTVAAVASEATYGHVAVVYAPIDLWRQATYGSSPDSSDLASAVAINAPGGTDLAAPATMANVDVVTKTEAYSGSPGYAAETSTMTLIRGFLYVIAAMILGAFFTVWTIQRRQEIGLQKALGASTRSVLIGSLGQVLIILIAATTVGALIGYALGLVVAGGNVPFSLQPGPVLAAAATLVLTGMAGVLVGVRRITRVDPIIALGGAE
jgi:putative ABC transport system permease protein